MQVPNVRKSDKRDTQHRQDRLGKTMAHGNRRRHERQTETAEHQRTEPPVTHDAEAKRNEADSQRQNQTVAVNRRRHQHTTTQSQNANEDHAEHAMHHAQAAQENPCPVQPVPNRYASMKVEHP